MTMPAILKRLSPPAICVAVALLGGVAGGATAVHGLSQKSYGPDAAPALVQASVQPGYAGEETAGCQDCSERDLGYRWATLAAVRSPDQCPNDSWGFRRGCLDYTGGV